MFQGVFHHPATPAHWGVVLGASAVAMAWDLRWRRIPNLLTLPLLVAGLAAAGAMRGGAGLADSLAGCLLLGIPYVALFLFAGGGGGDAKLMAAIGAWVGFASGISVLLAVAVSGGVLGLAFAASRGRLRPVLNNLRVMGEGVCRVAWRVNTPTEAADLMPQQAAMMKMPYGVAICVGVWAAAAKVLLWPT
jgi:Flp pilus assembly protein protease CpaA